MSGKHAEYVIFTKNTEIVKMTMVFVVFVVSLNSTIRDYIIAITQYEHKRLKLHESALQEPVG